MRTDIIITQYVQYLLLVPVVNGARGGVFARDRIRKRGILILLFGGADGSVGQVGGYAHFLPSIDRLLSTHGRYCHVIGLSGTLIVFCVVVLASQTFYTN